jgi:hypothetical protein
MEETSNPGAAYVGFPLVEETSPLLIARSTGRSQTVFGTAQARLLIRGKRRAAAGRGHPGCGPPYDHGHPLVRAGRRPLTKAQDRQFPSPVLTRVR